MCCEASPKSALAPTNRFELRKPAPPCAAVLRKLLTSLPSAELENAPPAAAAE